MVSRRVACDNDRRRNDEGEKEDDDDDDNDDDGDHDYDGENLDVAADKKHDYDNHAYDNACDDDDDDGTDDDDRSDGDNNNDNHEGKAFAIRTAPRRGGGEGGGACTMDLKCCFCFVLRISVSIVMPQVCRCAICPSVRRRTNWSVSLLTCSLTRARVPSASKEEHGDEATRTCRTQGAIGCLRRVAGARRAPERG